MAKQKKFFSQKKTNHLQNIGKDILKFMGEKSNKIYNYKQISDGIDQKNPRQRELVIQTLHQLLANEKI